MATLQLNVEKTFNPQNEITAVKSVANNSGNHYFNCSINSYWIKPRQSESQRKSNLAVTNFSFDKSQYTGFACALLLTDLTSNGYDGYSLAFRSNLTGNLAPTNITFSNPNLGYVEWLSSVDDVFNRISQYTRSGISATSSSRYPISEVTLSIDVDFMPIFDNETSLNLYLETPNENSAKLAINYKFMPPEEPNDFFIYSQNIGQEIDNFGNVSRETSVEYRDMRFVLEKNKKACFYFKENKNQRYDVYLLTENNPIYAEYSTDGLTFEQYASGLPWRDFCYKTPHWSDDGLLYKAVFWQTNIPLFLDESSAQEYLDGTIGIEDSYNYNELTENADKSVNIGQVIEDMTVNATSARGMFCSRYALGLLNITEITDKLFTNDENVINAVIGGLKFYGQEPMQSVIDLTYYPFNITQYGNTSPQQYIYFGNYKLDLDNAVNKIVNMGIVIDCGNATMPITYNDYRDYEPYTEMYVYLPYCGLHKLNIASYIGKTISVKYGVDITTGACSAFIFANNKLVDTFTGSMGVRQFITSMDSAEYASNILNAVTGGAGDTATGGAMTLKSLGAQTVGGFAGGLTMGAGGLAVGMGKGLHNLKNAVENVPFSTRGSTTSMLGQYAPQYPYFVFAYATTYTSDILNIVGKPTNASGKVYNFSGFLQCADVKLTSRATDEEKREIVSILQNGIYI